MSKKKTQKEVRFNGYFLMDSGIKINFDISEEFNSGKFRKLLDCEWSFEKDDVIWLGEENPVFILADRIVGFWIDTYEIE